MRIKWLGHACFLITSDTGIRIITDPYMPAGDLTYGEINETADIVTVSHEHLDHNNTKAVRGNPVILRKYGKAKDIDFKAIATFHDANKGLQRGANTIFCFTLDGLRICHAGDLGHMLDNKTIIELGRVDIMLIPVGGNFTLDAPGADKVINMIKPAVVIPMHYQTEKSRGMKISSVAAFIRDKSNVTRLNSSEVELKAENLPAAGRIIVLQPAL